MEQAVEIARLTRFGDFLGGAALGWSSLIEVHSVLS